jgi:geranylgeranyl pyrophosphate synthase
LEESKIRAKELAGEAKKILQPLSKNADNLHKLAEYVVSRET